MIRVYTIPGNWFAVAELINKWDREREAAGCEKGPICNRVVAIGGMVGNYTNVALSLDDEQVAWLDRRGWR